MSVELASAYISILPSAKGFSAALEKQIGTSLDSLGFKWGQKTGAEFGASFSKSFANATVGLDVSVSRNMAKATSGAASHGADAGGNYAKGFKDSSVKISADVDTVFKSAKTSAAGAGTDSGKSFVNGISGSKRALTAAADAMVGAFAAVFGPKFVTFMKDKFDDTKPVAADAGEAAGKSFADKFKDSAASLGHGLLTAGGVAAKGLGTLAKAGAIAGGAAATGIASIAGIGVETAAQMEQANIAFTTMLGSGKKAQSFLSDLQKFAAKTPFEFPELETAASSLVSVGIDADKVIPIMTTLGNATSGMGTGAEGVKRATVAIQQMSAAGKISAEDLNQLRDAGVPVFELLTAATGKTTAEIADMAANGKLGRKELDQLMDSLGSGKGLERFNGLMDQQSQSLVGLKSTFHDTFTVGMADAVQPLIPLLKEGLVGATQLLTDVVLPKLKVLFGEAAGGIVAFTAAWKANDGDVTSSGFPGFMERAAFWIHQVADWMKTLDFSSFSGFLSSLGGSGGGPAAGTLASIGESVKALVPAAKEFGQEVPDLFASGLQIINSVLAFLASNVDTIIKWMPLIVGLFVGWKAATWALNAAQAFAVPLQIALNITRIAAAAAQWKAAQATRAATTATVQQTGAEQVSLITKARHLAANIAHHTSVLALTIAHKAHTAAVWLSHPALWGNHAATVAVTTAEQASLTTRLRSTASMIGHKVATIATSVATKAAAAGQWLLNAAMSANPIGIVVVAIGLLVASLIWFFTQTELGRDIIKNVWGFIQDVIAGFVNWFNGSVLPVISAVIKGVGDVFNWLWTNVIQPVLGFIGAAFGAWWLLSKFIFEAFVAVVTKIIAPAFIWLWTDVIKPAFEGIGTLIGWWWNNVVLPVFKAVNDFMHDVLGPVFDWLWKTIIKPAFDGIGAVIKAVWDGVIKPIFDTWGDVLTKTLPKAFGDGVAVIGAIWNGIQEVIKAPIRFVIETVLNDGLIGAFNGIASFLGITPLPRIALPAGFNGAPAGTGAAGTGGGNGVRAFAAGGWTGPGEKYAPAGIVHADEFVFTKEQTRKAGVGNLYGIASALDGYATGGLVHPVPNSWVSQWFWSGHNGIDFAADFGTPVYAAGPGKVTQAAWSPFGGGNEIHVDHPNGLQTWYAHLASFAVKLGDIVRGGQQIGAVDSTGNSTGNHLHFMVLNGGWPNVMDPAPFLSAAGGQLPQRAGGGGGSPFNPVAAVIDTLVGQFTTAFPQGGKLINLIGGVGKNLLQGAADFLAGLFGANKDSSARGQALGPTVFDGGGWLENTGGMQLIQHNGRRPDAVLSHSQWETMTRIADDAQHGTEINFNGPVYGNPQHIVDEIEASKRRAATYANLTAITMGG